MSPEDIRSLRAKLQMDRDEFAKKLGLSHRASVWKLEMGKTKPSGPLLALLRMIAEHEEEKERKRPKKESS